MNPYRKLSGQALVYGLGNIVPRVLNYAILTFYYTRKFAPEEYGVVTELYAYVAILLILLTYGMETGLFKFSSDGKSKAKVFSTALLSVTFTSIVFIITVYIFKKHISSWINYKNNPEYILYLSLAVAMDAIAAILFAKLRIENHVRKFALYKIINVVITIFAVFLFLEILPSLSVLEKNAWYNLHLRYIGVGYVFIANTIASFFILVLLTVNFIPYQIKPDWHLLIKLLKYSVPLLVAGLAGIFNETLDRILLPRLLPENYDALYELGIYGANYRIAVLLTIFIQMFRYAAEPFFFNIQRNLDSKEIYANVLKYFTIFMMIIFLAVGSGIDFFKHFIDSSYHEGLSIVPVILMANVFVGMLFNINMWYKLSGNTMYGVIITATGAIITIILNIMFIPLYSYKACAWIHVITNFTMLALTYYYGQRMYKIPYDIVKIGIYIIAALVLYVIGQVLRTEKDWINISIALIIVMIYILFCNQKEKLFKIFLKKHEN